jgi:hypothetical protein
MENETMLTIRKQETGKGKGWEAVIDDGTCAWVGDTKAEVQAQVNAVAHLLDWATITNRESFGQLPSETRRAIGVAGHEAKQAYRDSLKAIKVAKQDEQDSMAIVYAAGVPWSDAPKVKPYKMVRLIPATYKGVSWTTDGYMAIIGLLDGVTDQTPASLDEIVPATLGDVVTPVAYYQQSKEGYAVTSNGGLVNAGILTFFTKRFPGCEFRTSGKLTPVTVHLRGELVGLFMPVNSSAVSVPDYIKETMERLC